MINVLKKAAKKLLGTEIASRTSDPNFYGALQFLPNPDTILRKMGKSQEVFDAIIADAHVIGELRPMRANIITYNWRISPGGQSSEDMRAFELAQQVYSKHPAPRMGWPDVFWNMHEAILRGQRIHEVVWDVVDGLQTPVSLIDRPNHRFVYGLDNELRLLTRENRFEGAPVDDYKFLISRHMPSYDNPYGVALLSSCFWPYTFKHGGFKFFVKFCEKYGIPWAVGKYPAGTAQAQIDALADGLARMVEDAIAAIPDSGAVELVEAGSSGSQLPQERLIQVCNAEMSKCLNSQTLATEINGQGSYAAAQTHRGREQNNGAADRKIVEDTNNELLAWMTKLNFAGAAAPKFEFYDEAEARKDWVEVFTGARDFLDVPVKFAHERLQIPEPVDGEAVLPRSAAPAVLPQGLGRNFSQSDFAASADVDPSPVTAFTNQLAGEAADPFKQILDVLRAKVDKAAKSGNLETLRDDVISSYGDLDSDDLEKVMSFAFSAAELAGRFDVSEEG
jgi:phage gp29-like protein